MTTLEFFQQVYLAKRDLSLVTEAKYLKNIGRFERWQQSTMQQIAKIDDVTPEMIDDWLNSGKDITTITAAGYRQSVSAMVRMRQQESADITQNPFYGKCSGMNISEFFETVFLSTRNLSRTAISAYRLSVRHFSWPDMPVNEIDDDLVFGWLEDSRFLPSTIDKHQTRIRTIVKLAQLLEAEK